MKLVNFKSIKEVTYIIIVVDRRRLTTYLSLNVTQSQTGVYMSYTTERSRVVKHIRNLILDDNLNGNIMLLLTLMRSMRMVDLELFPSECRRSEKALFWKLYL